MTLLDILFGIIIPLIASVTWSCFASEKKHWGNSTFRNIISPLAGGIFFGSMSLCGHVDKIPSITGIVVCFLLFGTVGFLATLFFMLLLGNGGGGSGPRDFTNQPIAGHRPGGSHKH